MLTILNVGEKEVDLSSLKEGGIYLVTQVNKDHKYKPNTIILSRHNMMPPGRFQIVYSVDNIGIDEWWVMPNSGYYGRCVSVEEMSVKLL